MGPKQISQGFGNPPAALTGGIISAIIVKPNSMETKSMKYKKIIKKWQKWCVEKERDSLYDNDVEGIKASRKHLEYLLSKHRPKTADETMPKAIEGSLRIYDGNPFTTSTLLAKIPISCELTNGKAKLTKVATAVIMHSGRAEWFVVFIGGAVTSGPIGDEQNPVSGINLLSKNLYKDANLDLETLELTFNFNKVPQV